MTTPSEFKAIKELRQIDDQGISGDLLMLLESEGESLKVFLSQLSSYITKPLETELIPPGVPQYWPGDAPPSGFAFINDGLIFDIVKYPKLATAWPSGVIPPHKGLVIECTADGSVTGETEVGEIKSHLHSINHGHNASSSSEFLGNELPDHDHQITPTSDSYIGGTNYISTGTDTQGGTKKTKGASAGTPSGSVSTTTEISNHNGNSGLTGQSRNTVDRINYNIMVRLA